MLARPVSFSNSYQNKIALPVKHKNNQNKFAGQTNDNVSFGTTNRKTDLNLGGENVLNSTRFMRIGNDTPEMTAKYLIERAQEAEHIEWKIWGCSDLSNFLCASIAMREQMGDASFDKHFNDIELIDIDPKIIQRAQSGIIGMIKADYQDINDFLGIDADKYFKQLPDEKVLDSEPAEIQTASLKTYAQLYDSDFYDYEVDSQKIIMHKFDEKFTKNAKIRQGDVREDIQALTAPKQGDLRIFEFSNAWQFLSYKDRIDLAFNFSRKMQKGDILNIGEVENNRLINVLLNTFGFERAKVNIGKEFELTNTFVKKEDKSIEELEAIRQKLFKKAEESPGCLGMRVYDLN